MTWHDLLNLHTIEHRHLLYAYGAVILLQGAYFGSVLRSWVQLKRSSR